MINIKIHVFLFKACEMEYILPEFQSNHENLCKKTICARSHNEKHLSGHRNLRQRKTSV